MDDMGTPSNERLKQLARKFQAPVDWDWHKEDERILIDPGKASAEDIAELFTALEEVYIAMGGDGLVFKVNDDDDSEAARTVNAAIAIAEKARGNG